LTAPRTGADHSSAFRPPRRWLCAAAQSGTIGIVEVWFPRPEKPDPTYRMGEEGMVPWLRRSTLPVADDCRGFLNRNLSTLPEGCREGILEHLSREQHYRDGFFELIVARTLQELGANIECEPINPVDGSRVDFVAHFPDARVFVEAVSPVLDKELGAIFGREAPVTKLIEDNVPPGWAADIRSLPSVNPAEPRRHIKAFLRREMDIPRPTDDDEEVEIRGSFDQGELRVILFPQSRHGLGADTKIAIHNAIGYFPNDKAALRGAVQRKRRQLRNLDGTTLVALNMFSTTAGREDLDEALFGASVSVRDLAWDEIRRYSRHDGLFAGGEGEPTISGVLAFPRVGFLRCDDPVLWVHPRFGGEFPQAFDALEMRRAPNAEPEVSVQPAQKTDLLRNLGLVERH
jgi:hypothetical protein